MSAHLQVVINTKVFPATIVAVKTTSNRDVTQFGGTIFAELLFIENYPGRNSKTYGDYFQELMDSVYYMRYCYEWIEPYMTHDIFLEQCKRLVKELGLECSIDHHDTYEFLEWQKEIRESNGI